MIRKLRLKRSNELSKKTELDQGSEGMRNCLGNESTQTHTHTHTHAPGYIAHVGRSWDLNPVHLTAELLLILIYVLFSTLDGDTS